MAKTKKKGKMSPATQASSKARNEQLPRLKTSAADLEKHTSDRASESDSSKDIFYDCRTCECNNTTSEHDNNKADLDDPGKGRVESSGAETPVSAVSAVSAVSVASQEPTLLDSPRPSLGRSRGHSLSKSVAHTDLEPGKAEDIKASLERIAAEGGPLQTLEEARQLRAQEREKIKRIRSDSITLIRERTRSRQNSLSSTRVNSPSSAAFSPTESQLSTPSITVTDESGLDMPPRQWTDSQIAAERIRRGMTRDEINRGPGATPVTPPNPRNPLDPMSPLNPANLANPLNPANTRGLTLAVPPHLLYNPVNYDERVAQYARIHNAHVGRDWGPSQPSGATPAAYGPSSHTIYTVAEATEPTTLDPAAQAEKEDFILTPRSLNTTLEKPAQKPRVYRSKSCVAKLASKQTLKYPPNPNPNSGDPNDPDDGDLTDPEDENPQPKQDPEPHAYTPWSQRCLWFYVSTDRAVNDEAIRAGEIPVIQVNFVEKPETRLNRYPGSTVDSRCDISPEPSATPLPTYMYDAPNDRFVVHASRTSFHDVRNDIGHPDHVPNERLLTYQAFEFAGFEVWRHDRRLFDCGYSGCNIDDLTDHELRTEICLGCGPKSCVRYCSKEHLIADIPTHWEWCGTNDVLLSFVVDEQTQPARFWRRFPMIEDRREQATEARHRQVVHAVFNKGQYTLFPEGKEKFVVEWPAEVKEVMLPRVERLLNVALHDRTCRGTISYLYRLLRHCLFLQDKWDSTNACQLYSQFSAEFGYDAPAFEWFEDRPCECEWTREHDFKDKSGKYHADCVFAVKGVGEIGRGKSIKEMVEALEIERWILRLWRRRMGVKGWKRRLRGEGFDGVITEDVEFIAANKWMSWGNVW